LLPAGAGIIAGPMPKSVRPTHRRHADVSRSRAHRSGGTRPKRDIPTRRAAPDGRRLLEPLLDTPHLAHVVPRLPPEVLQRVIQNCGLEECGELVTLATAEQLVGVFDLDMWRVAQPRRDEQFDADRFGLWLEVLMESGSGMPRDPWRSRGVAWFRDSRGQRLDVRVHFGEQPDRSRPGIHAVVA
jgi:hypothetical protein